ncbi:hypothetical protein AQUCO_00901058v1 [Aquilegia coerulea]|uniref:Uncharacterized protein n=1 Tax=Aquilegia coerulea TaxID=218851 RepID=A0A2G5EGK5_AQUCA|nr:hypothetical protein AQUCO_00901058v1 [Aquilegia coerulea]
MVMPMGHDRMSTMFEFSPFNLTDFSKDCRKSYGIEPRPHWITTEYGGEFGSNIIFSNGLKDPNSCGGTCVSATRFKIPRLSPYPRNIIKESTEEYPAMNTTIYYYSQTLDHFNYRPESYITFQQKYVINFSYWGGANTSAPIFLHLGGESAMGDYATDNGLAAQFNALIVAIEHRYYGDSVPFGSIDKAFENASTLGYFSSAQAIADYVEVILHVKKILSAESCPVVVIGGSYAGMLASWFRLKYPHIAIGALASSAPILYFDGIGPKDGYYGIVSKDFRDYSRSCHNTIRQSWSKIDEIANKTNGLSILSRKFKTCAPLNTSFELKDYLDSLYCQAAQYNRGPNFMVNEVCNAINEAPKGTGVLGRVFAGAVALEGNDSCYDTTKFTVPYTDGWGWQTCTEMVMPIGHGVESTMFQYSPFDLGEYSKSCREKYGVDPRPHWVTTEFGGQDIEQVLAKFGSNIIFSNGLRDPYSSGGVLHNISDNIVALTTANGSHCLDFAYPHPTDPEWLVKQRESEVEIISGWIANYNANDMLR